jgi:hypothetical protein
MPAFTREIKSRTIFSPEQSQSRQGSLSNRGRFNHKDLHV